MWLILNPYSVFIYGDHSSCMSWQNLYSLYRYQIIVSNARDMFWFTSNHMIFKNLPLNYWKLMGASSARKLLMPWGLKHHGISIHSADQISIALGQFQIKIFHVWRTKLENRIKSKHKTTQLFNGKHQCIGLRFVTNGDIHGIPLHAYDRIFTCHELVSLCPWEHVLFLKRHLATKMTMLKLYTEQTYHRTNGYKYVAEKSTYILMYISIT